MTARRLLAIIAAPLAALVLPATASALTIDGSPLNIASDELGQIQVWFDGSETGEFYPSSLSPANAGFGLWAPANSNDLHGGAVAATGFQPVFEALGGDGSPADPFTLTTTYQIPSSETAFPIQIDQEIEYVNGAGTVDVDYELTTDVSAPSPADVRAFVYADLYVNGNDSGVGLFEPGPPRAVGGVNQDTGSSGALVEDPDSPWTAYEAGNFSTVRGHISLDPPSLDNTVSNVFQDNGVAVQWSGTLTSMAPFARGVTWRFTRFAGLVLDPPTGSRTAGEAHGVLATAQNSDGRAGAGQLLRFKIDGANPLEGSATTGVDGKVAITWIGNNAGSDVLTAYSDLNGNGTREGNEPQRTASVDWAAASPSPPAKKTLDDLPDPTPFKEVNVEPVRGQVYVRLPSRGSAGSSQAVNGAPKGFLPLTEAAQLPIRSIVETSNGAVKLESAKSQTGSVTQTGTFFSGRFQVIQKRARRPVTEMVLKGSSFRGCPRTRRAKGSRAEADGSARRRTSRTRVRRLWGDGRGRFRTRGRYSSATVRGTKWVVEDRCGGTVTRLPRRPRNSRVDVRDFGRRKTVRLRAGRSYLALPRAARKRR